MSTTEPQPRTTLNAAKLDALLSVQNLFAVRAPTLDLRDVAMVTPGALVQMAALCHALRKKGPMCTVIPPCAAVCTYLARSGWVQAVDRVVRFSPKSTDLFHPHFAQLRGSNGMLLEVTVITSNPELSILLPRIVSTLQQRLRFSKTDAYDVATAMSELCQNIFDHNARARGFVAMQVYGLGDKRFVEIGVADYGAGLARTLRDNPAFSKVRTDERAILTAVEQGTSRFVDDKTRGTGLYHLLEIGKAHGGMVEIRSGKCRMRYRLDLNRSWPFACPDLPGVQVVLRLNTKKSD